MRAVEDDAGAEVGEGDGVSAAAAVAFDRDVPLGGSGDGEAGGLDRSRRGGGWRLWRCGRLRGGCGGRGRRGWGRPFLLEARRRVVTDGQLGMQHAGPIEQQLVRLGDVGVRHAAIDRADGRAGLVIVEPDALGALFRHDVEDVVRDGCVHGAVGRLPFDAALVDGGVGALRLAGAAVDALAGDHRRHVSDQ